MQSEGLLNLIRYVLSVAAGFQPAVEPGILPGGLSCRVHSQFRVQSCLSGRQDAALYGSQDGCRYSRKATLRAGRGELELTHPIKMQ